MAQVSPCYVCRRRGRSRSILCLALESHPARVVVAGVCSGELAETARITLSQPAGDDNGNGDGEGDGEGEDDERAQLQRLVGEMRSRRLSVCRRQKTDPLSLPCGLELRSPVR